MDGLTDHTFFPFPAHPFCTQSDELMDTLKRVLQQTATGSGAPQLARLARRALAELRRIQTANELDAISEFVARELH